MRIEAAIACVGYDDFLRITLGPAIRSVDRLTVVTAPWDGETAAVASAFGAELLVTDAWRVNGRFNKARALNEWIDGLAGIDQETWLMSLDADILLPADRRLHGASLESGSLYGARRRMCTDEAEWQEYRESKRGLDSFRLDLQPIVGGRLWGTLSTTNDAGLLGYLQLWNPIHGKGWRRFRETPTAANYDVLFGLSFPERSRKFLEDYEVLHLGPPRVNWAGRRSARWRMPDAEGRAANGSC